jgi:hypothetical protein
MSKGPKAYLLAAEAWLWLLLGRLLLLFVPFRKIARLLGKAMHQGTQKDDDNVGDTICIAILRAGKRSPWRAKCFEQAIAAKIMLKLRGVKSTIYFAVNKNENSMLAHAWLKVNGKTITGGPEVEGFKIISWFGD